MNVSSLFETAYSVFLILAQFFYVLILFKSMVPST